METIPSNRIDGYRWLIETKGFELIKLQRKNKVPVRHESGWAKRTERRSFDDIRLNVSGSRPGLHPNNNGKFLFWFRKLL